MDMTEKNGQPSMEEILASIRRIIAEEPASPPPGIEIKPRTLALAGDTSFDEHADFDLPSIFRTPAPAPEKPALLGRLTDAIRGATAPSPEAKSARAGEELSAADHADHTPGAPRNGAAPPQYPALSSLKTGRPDQHAADQRHSDSAPGADPAHAPPPAPPASAPAQSGSAFSGWKFGRAAAPPPAIEDEIKRVMTPFKDTRFQQMAHVDSATPAESQPPAQPQHVQPEQPRVDFGSIIPAHMDLPGIPAVEQHRWPHAGPAPHDTTFGTPPRSDALSPPEPPHYAPDHIAPMAGNPLTQSYYDPAYGRTPGPADEPVVQFRPQQAPGQPPPTGTIEDTTAELLRPMLRQWLADNMPRMVEKALHIEVAESVRTGRKLPGQ